MKGLTDEQVLAARLAYGSNTLSRKKNNRLGEILKAILGEPMVLLLLAACVLYLLSGQAGDALLLLAAIVIISTISLYQDRRSRNALAMLQELTQPRCKVIRNGSEAMIKTEELVPGDCLVIEEGEMVPADGNILKANDFSVNQAVLTGEAFPVSKNESTDDRKVFSGTTVTTGLAFVEVTETGDRSELGKIGSGLQEINEEKTPLEKQVNDFVKKMAIAGIVVFFLVWGLNFYLTESLMQSLLKALTLAMSILPEEIPVALASFMALGAWRLMKSGIVVKQVKTVEALGSATVICVDKTGTITQNKMSLAKLYTHATGGTVTLGGERITAPEAQELVRIGMFASEPVPFDPMEKALHDVYAANIAADERPNYTMVHEYPLGGKPPMMTHVFESANGQRIIAAKGAPEALLAVSNLTHLEKATIKDQVAAMAAEGYRVLAVGRAEAVMLPPTQQELRFGFMGLLAFYDPPKQNIAAVLESFYKAGIDVKIITGDNSLTTTAIAKQIGFRGHEDSMTGEELMRLSDSGLRAAVEKTAIFSRMFPEAKLRIINALKANGQVVAMTGDGVNDGLALKAAHIGIAMGKRGTATAKDAASLVLVEDDLSKMVEAVAMGRRIYSNLRKAIQYIISIHIPIILIIFIPLLLGWEYTAIFSPVHVIVLELIMGPTCSIAFESDPMENNAMQKKPRALTGSLFNRRELGIALLQGIAVNAGLVAVYKYAAHKGYSEELARTMVFTTLVMANILLTEVSRSRIYSVFTVVRYKNALIGNILAATAALLVLTLTVPALRSLLAFSQATWGQLFLCMGVAAVSVLWYEIFKYYKRRHQSSTDVPINGTAASKP